jgi:hypothetical protein
MRRVTSGLLFLVGALLVVTWVVAPASSAPPQVAVTAPSPPPPPFSPELDAINREVDRLRQRLASPVPDLAPARDPFQFVEPRVSAEREAERSEPLVIEPVVATFTTWPTLVAILSSGSDAQPELRAVFEDGSQLVHIRSVGDTIDEVTVTAVASDVVELTHVPSGITTLVTLR